MATREEILEEIRESKGEILGLETEQRLAKSEALKIAIGAQITAKQETLTVEKQRLLHLEQQGKSSRISIVPSQFSRCNPLPNLVRHLPFCNSSNSAIIPILM